jgi:acetate kinase
MDVLVFTGGIGERSAYVRERLCAGLDYLGLIIDRERNAGVSGVESEIHAASSRSKILVIPTDEELVIAREALEWLQRRP